MSTPAAKRPHADETIEVESLPSPIRKAARKFQVAYLCMEYALEEGLELYSGGLGILAGDIIKTVVDKDLSMFGVGILWDEGYTSQTLLKDGTTLNEYPKTDRSKFHFVECPEFSVTVNGEDISLRAYTVEGYGTKLYLLEPVEDKHRAITRRLYQGPAEDRLAQEVILGLGAVRFVRAAGLQVDLFHFNEGHAVFAGLELVHEHMTGQKKHDFNAAWAAAKQSCVFTTHTPVKAGNETHSIESVLKAGISALGLDKNQLESIGGSPFGMTEAAFALSTRCNAVAQLHRDTAAEMWKLLKTPPTILGITNGVHVGSWQDTRLRDAFKGAESTVAALKAEDSVWSAHMAAKEELIAEIRNKTGVELSSDALLVGFARRAATYKRHTLLFFHKAKAVQARLQSETDAGKEGTTASATEAEGAPVEETKVIEAFQKGRMSCVFSGKAHPNDDGGKEVIRILHEVQLELPASVVYLDNYGMKLGRLLTRGCDVWLNTPVRPMEASGTSGMKAAMNGVLNVSILDGWWPEMCINGVNGWQIGKAEAGEGDAVDKRDVAYLHKVLLDEVLPTYEEAEKLKWRTMMRASIKDSVDIFSSDRMVEEYWQKLYKAN